MTVPSHAGNHHVRHDEAEEVGTVDVWAGSDAIRIRLSRHPEAPDELVEVTNHDAKAANDATAAVAPRHQRPMPAEGNGS